MTKPTVSKYLRKPVGLSLCYNNTTLGNRLDAWRKGPNMTNPICWTSKNCSHECAADCEHCHTTQHGAVLIIFPFNLQTISITQHQPLNWEENKNRNKYQKLGVSLAARRRFRWVAVRSGGPGLFTLGRPRREHGRIDWQRRLGEEVVTTRFLGCDTTGWVVRQEPTVTAYQHCHHHHLFLRSSLPGCARSNDLARRSTTLPICFALLR